MAQLAIAYDERDDVADRTMLADNHGAAHGQEPAPGYDPDEPLLWEEYLSVAR